MQKKSKAGLEDFLEEDEKAFNVYFKERTRKEYSLYLNGTIESSSQFEAANNQLRSANEGDLFNIYINSGGGSLSASLELVNSIQSSQALVMGHIVADASSAAGMIFLACDEWALYDVSTMMVHNITAGAGGKGHELKAHAKFLDKLSHRILNKFYAGFLTKKEIASVYEGKDLYLFSEDIFPRLEKLRDHRIQQIEESELYETEEEDNETKH